jgi:YidC/Oxa1 family membrane protein insertase
MAINPQQQKIMAFLPIVMVFICLKMPAGVLLYWASSQVISTIQQIMANRSIDAANGIITVKS